MCLGNSPDPGTFSSLLGVKSVLPGEFLLIYPKTFGGPPGVLQRGVLERVQLLHSDSLFIDTSRLEPEIPDLKIFKKGKDRVSIWVKNDNL